MKLINKVMYTLLLVNIFISNSYCMNKNAMNNIIMNSNIQSSVNNNDFIFNKINSNMTIAELNDYTSLLRSMRKDTASLIGKQDSDKSISVEEAYEKYDILNKILQEKNNHDFKSFVANNYKIIDNQESIRMTAHIPIFGMMKKAPNLKNMSGSEFISFIFYEFT